MRKFVQGLAWAILVLRLGYFDLLEVLRARSINDYGSFHAAAVAISEGLDPYSLDDLQQAARVAKLPTVHPYFYPPLLAELLLPATLLPPFYARLVWMALTVAAMILAVGLLERWLGGNKGERATTAFLVATCALWPLRSTQMMAQVNGFILLLLVVWWCRRERSPWAGAFLALAAAVKMSPLLLVVVPLSQRRWREALIIVGSTAGMVLGSCALLGSRGLHFFSDVLFGFLPGHQYHGLGVPIDFTGNHSVGALAYWIFDEGNGDRLHLSSMATAFQVCGILGLLAGVGVGVWRGATVEGRTAALVVVMIVAPTYAFEHHLTFIVLPIALVCWLIAQDALREAWVSGLVVALALLTEHEASFVPPGWAPLWWMALGHTSKLLPLLTVYAAALVARPSRATADPGRDLPSESRAEADSAPQSA